MNTFKRRGALAGALLGPLLALGALGMPVGAWADDQRVQPLLMPMKELLKRLDAAEEWVLLPLADYRAMVAAGDPRRGPASGGAPPSGAWIESASIAGVLEGDRDLLLDATLEVASVAPAAARCRIFATAPARLGAIAIDGQPALYAAGEDGLDLVVPGPGHHRVTLAWTAKLDRGDERDRRGAVPLPVAGGVDLRLRSATPGAFSGEAVAEAPAAGAPGWRLVKSTGAVLDLAWHPGRLAASDAAVFGVRQALQVMVQEGQRPFRWAARLEPRRGELPGELTLVLPTGWVMTAAVSGVVAIEGRERVRLRIDPRAREIACDGFMGADAVVALPGIEDAAYAGGTVVLGSGTPFDYQLPPGWRSEPPQPATTPAAGGAARPAPPAAAVERVFAVAAPDAGMRVTPLAGDAGPSVAASACVLLGPHPGDWAIEQTIEMRAAGARLFALPLQLPPGWKLGAFSASQPATIAQLADGSDLADLPAGASLGVRLAGGATAATFELRLVRASADPGAAKGEAALASVPSARRSSQRALIVAAPGLDVRIGAGALWRLDAQGGAVAGALAPLVRAELLATGAPGAIALEVAPTPPVAEAEAVWYALPALGTPEGGESWCRLDLRLRVRDGELDALVLDAPLLRTAKLQLDDQLFALAVEDRRLVLRARQAWRGEHLLRIEGPLDPAATGRFPRVRLARLAEAGAAGGGQELPLRQAMALQAPANADLVVKPGTGCTPIDEDDLPAWSRPIPGAPVFAAFRCLLAKDAELGGYALVQRPLAPAPGGFIDQLEARTQIAAAGTITLVRLRVAAPGAQALPLGLPPGATLSEATIDGLACAVRRQGGELVLPLPGRTQVEVALLILGAAPAEEFRLALPRFGGLPVTGTVWSVAVDDHWRVEVVDDAQAMPLTALGGAAARRGWFGDWRASPDAEDLQALPRLARGQAVDPRALAVAAKPTAPRGEPALALAGHLYRGERIGSGGELRLRLAPLEALRAWDRVGRVAGVLIALLVAAACGRRRGLTAAAALLLAAAALAAMALHAWEVGAGPLLALCETLMAGLPAAWIAVALVRLAPRHGAVAAGLLAALLAGPARGAEPPPCAPAQPVLMGYQRLDQAGLPQDVRVALTRAALTELWTRAHPEAAAAVPPCDLATGAASYALSFADGSLRGELRLPLAVLSAQWQQLRLEVLPGSVRAVRFEALGGSAPAAGAASWSMDGAALVASVAGRQQGVLVVELAWTLLANGGGWSGALPVLATRGGRIELSLPASEPLTPALGGEDMAAPSAAAGEPRRWSAQLAPGAGVVELSLRRADAQAPKELHLGFEQRLRATLAPGRIEWAAELAIAAQGGTLRDATLALPPGLAVTAVEGPALASWRQQGATLALAWSTAQGGTIAVRASGVRPRAVGAGAAELVLHLAGAERSSGRLDLAGDADARFLRPEHAQVERAEPAAGCDLALRWADDPAQLAIAWEAQRGELRLAEQCALVAGLDRVRVTALCSLAGRGASDALRLRLAEPWRLVAAPAGLSAVVQGAGPARALLLRGAGPWVAGASVVIELEAERGALAGPLVAPDLSPLDSAPGEGPAWERQTWLVGDAGDRRLRLDQPGLYGVLGVEAAATALARAGVALRAGERWRLACERRSGPPPALSLVAEGAQVRVSASHYLVLGQERVRWWAHLVYAVGQGELRELRCTLPAGARLERLAARDLGGYELAGREVVARLAAPARQAVALELELSVPLADAAATLVAPATPAGLEAQQVALVEEDDLGLVHLDAQGLEDDREAPLLMPLPEGVDAKLVPHRWHALRPGWQLTVRREALATSPGVDGVATLVDAVTVIARDGDLRGRATWHVLNRTRQQLPLTLPAGVELWEARVNGELVRPRLGAAGAPAAGAPAAAALWLPVRPQRPGEAALRIALTWRQRVDVAGRFVPLMPVFPDLRLIQALWRVVPPEGFELVRRDGALQEGRSGDAEGDRARCVIEELQRLRTQGELNDAGLKRLSDQLNGLDLELNDYLVGMQQAGGDQAVVQAAQRARHAPAASPPPNQPASQPDQAQQAVIDAVNSNRAQVQQELQRIGSVYEGRQGRRKGLGLSNYDQNWKAEQLEAAATGGDFIARRLPARLPWQDALAVATNGSLGPGEPPPGFRIAGAGGLLGLDLLGERTAGGLVLRGQGADLSVELSLRGRSTPWWPWLCAAAALLALAAAARLARR